jgi:hypothetical protein
VKCFSISVFRDMAETSWMLVQTEKSHVDWRREKNCSKFRWITWQMHCWWTTTIRLSTSSLVS